MTAAVSTLVEIGELSRTRPGLHALATVVAAWYEQKAVTLGHIAAETGDPDAERCSHQAHAHAAALLADPCHPTRTSTADDDRDR